MSFTPFNQGKNVFLFINIVLWLNAALCCVFIWACAHVCEAEICLVCECVCVFFSPRYLRSYLHLKAVDSRLSNIRNVKVRQSGAQMCVCGLWVCAGDQPVYILVLASELNDPFARCSLWLEGRKNSCRVDSTWTKKIQKKKNKVKVDSAGHI